MASMSQTWSICIAVTVLTMQVCAGGKSCVMWSSAGLVVRRGSSFDLFCTFKCKCTGSMYSHKTLQNYKQVNSTTIRLNVVNITKNITYSCECKCPSHLDPCGLDISTGYPPDPPSNISCQYTVENFEVFENASGVVSCSWNPGRDTYLRGSSVLWVRTGNHTAQSVEGSDKQTASFPMNSSVQLMSVWVRVQNPLDSAESIPMNITLSDIVMPPAPALAQPQCSSRDCIVQVEQNVTTQHLEIQYSTDTLTWTSYQYSDAQLSLVEVRSIASLEPYRLYYFQARSKFSTGLWSEWSTNVTCWTQEEAPAKELDVWYAEPASDFESPRVYWKEPDISIARGGIIEYQVSVRNRSSGSVLSTNVNADSRNYPVSLHPDCEVTVFARNSKGLSPPARIITHYTNAEPLEIVQEPANNHSVTISWKKPETAPPHVAYVVEWYPERHKLKELQWIRLGSNDDRTVITGIRPFECYEGAVYVIYNHSSVSWTRFTGITTLESAPSEGPSVQEKVDGNKVNISWSALPSGQCERGCITSYNIYLENGSGEQKHYPVSASERKYTIKDLSPDFYSLWMTASTAKGEGPAGQKVKFFIQQDGKLSILMVFVFIFLTVLTLMCLCQCPAVKQRLWVLLQCFLLDVVPDPANSKWAKECTQEKGKMNLQLQPSDSSVTEEEEEPILVDVEELCGRSGDTHTSTDLCSQLPPQTGLNALTDPATPLYPLTTYIKSFSHDSDSSEHTQTSLDTNTTVDYISSHGMQIMDEEDQDEEYEEEEFVDVLDFFPSHNIVIESLEFGGKLTLDAVKIDCNDFLQNSCF